MSKIEEEFIRLNQDFFPDENDLGRLISVIVDYDYYNVSNKYEYCLLIELITLNNKLRPRGMTILFEGKIKKIALEKLNSVKIKFFN